MLEKELENKEEMQENQKYKLPPWMKKWLDVKMLLLAGIIGRMAWTTFTTGAEVQYQTHFQESLQTDAAKAILKKQNVEDMDDALTDKNFLAKAFSSDGIIDEIDKQIKIAKQHIIDEVVSADSSKIDFVGGIAVGAELRDEAIMPILIKLVKAIDNGELVFKADIEDMIEDEVKNRVSRTVRANF